MSAMFGVIDLDDGWTGGAREPGGDERKRWFHAPDTSPYAGHWLFKPRTEKMLLLAEVDPSFDTRSCVGHTVSAVRDVLANSKVSGPINSIYADWPAFDVWAGYLVLDAWIANTDRHAHNWGVLLDEASGKTCLSPSFDHGSALAAGDHETNRAKTVSGGSVEQWCERGHTFRFNGGARRDLIDLAAEAVSVCSVDARWHWVRQINAVDLALCDDVIHRIPNMSESTRSFVSTVVTTNRKRLCDALH
ncbi:MAG: hypothetical protein QM673_17545 [Gordonia sp. (in: high G+C Gram-positive bacteria)]